MVMLIFVLLLSALYGMGFSLFICPMGGNLLKKVSPLKLVKKRERYLKLHKICFFILLLREGEGGEEKKR